MGLLVFLALMTFRYTSAEFQTSNVNVIPVYSSVWSSNMLTCARTCDNDVKCTMFAFSDNTRVCFLGNSAMGTNQAVDIGVVVYVGEVEQNVGNVTFSNVTEPEQSGNVSAPEQSGNVTEPEQSGNVTEPEQSGNVTEPEQGGNVTEPEQSGNVTEPEQGGNVTEPEQSSNVTEPEQSGNVTEPGQSSNETGKEVIYNYFLLYCFLFYH